MTSEATVRGDTRQATMGGLLCAFAYASDIAFGLPLEDSLKSCYVALRLAETLGYSPAECTSAYYTALLKDAGCTSWTTELASAWESDEIAARRDLIKHVYNKTGSSNRVTATLFAMENGLLLN